MMGALARILPPRLLLPMLAAAMVFVMTGTTFGQHEGSFAQTPTASPGPSAEPEAKGTPANSDPQTVGPDGRRVSCAALPESRGGFLLGRIVPCLLKTIEGSASRFSREMILMVRPIFFAFLTFVMVMFGLQVLQNEGQLQTRAFILLLKIGFVIAVLQMIPGNEQTGKGGLIGAAYAIMGESQAAMMDAIGPDAANVHCEIERYGDANTPLIWKQMDCLLGKLYGFTVGTPGPSGQARPNMLLASSVLGLLGGFFFSGTIGAAMFLACIGVLVSMFTLVIRVVIAFVNSYLFIALYMIMAPLLLPMIFLKVTTNFFEKWYSGIIAALLMPIVISAYVVLAMQLYDKLMFADDSLVANLFKQEWIRDAQQLPRQACNREITGDPAFRALASGKSEKSIYTNNPFVQLPGSLLSGGNDLCGGLRLPVLNLDATKDKGSYDTARKKFEKLFYDLTKLFVLTYLISMGFETVKSAIRPMLGSSAVVASLDASSKVEERMQTGFSQAQANFRDSFRVVGASGQLEDTRGTGFLARIPIAAGSGAQGFLSGISGSPNPGANHGTSTPRAQPQPAPARPAGGDADGGDDTTPGSSSPTPNPRPTTTVPRSQVRSPNTSSNDKIALAVANLPAPAAAEFTQLERKTTRTAAEQARYDELLQQIEGDGD